MATKNPSIKFPKTLGACIDDLYKRREERLQLDRKVEALKAEEKAYREHIIGLLSAQKLDGGKGTVATAAITWKRTLVLSDWAKFWEWARKDKLGVYVHKRVAVEAAKEWMEDQKKTVPGIDPLDVVDLSLTKVGS